MSTVEATVVPDVPEDGVLLPYQQRLLATTAVNRVTLFEKSRRIGATWGIGAQAVLTSGAARTEGGMDTFYIGYNLDMAREFVDVCGMWARNLNLGAGEVGEFLFTEQDEKGVERSIQAFRITFASGFEIVALASRPRSLRGRQGFVIIDEAAFHDDLNALLKAALALLIWGGRILIISTHDGNENPFNLLIEECRAGKKPFAVLRTTFDEAVEEGVYRRVCLKLRQPWSAEAEAAWKAEIRAFYGDGAGEELDVIPREGGGKYLPLHLIEARASRDIPVLRWACDQKFVHLPEHQRTAAALAWCEEVVRPHLERLNPLLRSAFGLDFARVGDLSVLWPVQVMPNLVRATPFTIELRNVPFDQQREILFYVGDRLPRLSAGALDSTGNGAYLAEKAIQRWGAHRIEGIHLTEGWYRENMPRVKAAFEDAGFTIPADEGVVGDWRSLEVIRGVARVPEKRSTAKGEDKDKAGGQRHGDAAIAGSLCIYAAGRDTGSTEHDSPLRELLQGDPRFQAFMGIGPGARGVGEYFG